MIVGRLALEKETRERMEDLLRNGWRLTMFCAQAIYKSQDVYV
jgi:hypothetical protein